MLSKKSPKRSCRIELRNNRLRQLDLLNQCCVSEGDLESFFLGETPKFFFRQYRSIASILPCPFSRPLSPTADISVNGVSRERGPQKNPEGGGPTRAMAARARAEK
jgi:hypothetical protein